MNNDFLFILMLFLNYIGDYVIQKAGFLAELKQKSWWEKNAPNPLYVDDYKFALLVHSFTWAFITMLPIAILKNYQIGFGFLILLIVNTVVHTFIDDLKANKEKINLWGDQILHIIQVLATFLIYIYLPQYF